MRTTFVGLSRRKRGRYQSFRDKTKPPAVSRPGAEGLLLLTPASISKARIENQRDDTEREARKVNAVGGEPPRGVA